MTALEVLVLLVAAVLVASLVSRSTRLAAPLAQVAVGLIVGMIPAVRAVEMDPEIVLLLFLPAILFWESLTTSLRALRRDLSAIVVLSTVGVVVTAFAVAGIAYALGMPWGAALILGAAVAPPDATAVAALGRRLPRRIFMLLKAESLTNDGTALVLYGIAVGVAVGESTTALAITGDVVVSYGGGAAVGLLSAGAAVLLMRRIDDPLLLNVVLIIAAFGAYLGAELIGASGVVATVLAGLVLAYMSGSTSTAASRRQTEAVWPLASMLLSGALFVLIGVEVQTIARQIDVNEAARLAGLSVAVWVTLLVVRVLLQATGVGLFRLVARTERAEGKRVSWRARVVVAMAGFRGAVSLAIALSVPLTMGDGTSLEGRDTVIAVTAGVIVLTLLVQGPLLPLTIRWSRLGGEDVSDAERQHAEKAMGAAALRVLDEAAARYGLDDTRRRAMKRSLVTASRRADDAAVHVGGEQQESMRDAVVGVRLEIIEAQREALARLRREGSIDDSVARRLQTRLDMDEVRLTGEGDLLD